MSNNAPDYEDNLAFDPTANSGLHRSYTDRTQSTIELIEKIEKLTKENERLKWWLREIVNNHRFTPISTAERALKELDK